jgi:hypothetical protein
MSNPANSPGDRWFTDEVGSGRLPARFDFRCSGRRLMWVVTAIIMSLLYAVPAGVAIAATWRIFEKAGQPGWAAIIPIYNYYVFVVEVVKKPILWFILLFVPCVNIYILIMCFVELAKAFGKEAAYAVGLILLYPIFAAILGFGSAQYAPPEEGAPRRRRRDEYDEEEEEERRPARRRAAVAEDEDEEPRRPARRRRADDEDEDEDEYEERPRRRR